MAGLTVACVLKVGEFRKRTYSPEWVQRLKSMVERHLGPHRFVCLSNVPIEGVETSPLKHDWPGWWSKVELFSHDLGERVLYLDLDVLITGSLDPLVNYPTPMAVMPPFEDSRTRYQTSCMVWTPPEGLEIYESFSADTMKAMRGDQDWISSIKRDCALLEPKWFRKLKSCQDGPPRGVKVVLSMPWKNDVAAQKFDWVRDVWS